MKYILEYRDKKYVDNIIKKLHLFDKRSYTFMEVCGGHTYAFHRFGLPSLLPSNFKLISGPGCPVCVTSKTFVDKVISLSDKDDIVITTFGDLMRVPGSHSSLGIEKSKGRDIRIVFSPMDALEFARSEPAKKFVFVGIGFETTAPGTAITIKEAKNKGISNFFVISAHKIMPPAMEAIVSGGSRIDGFVCPGHVSAITGSSIYDFLPEKFGVGCVVTGFEPVDMLQAIYMLTLQVEKNAPQVEIQYRRVVTREGNLIAQKALYEVFEFADDWWRGLGIIPKSGLKISKNYSDFDIENQYQINVTYALDDKGCICGDILKGLKSPPECRYFAKKCSPSDPVGACMVSSEGACHTYYNFHNNG